MRFDVAPALPLLRAGSTWRESACYESRAGYMGRPAFVGHEPVEVTVNLYGAIFGCSARRRRRLCATEIEPEIAVEMATTVRRVATSLSTLLALFACAGACSSGSKSTSSGGSFCDFGPACKAIVNACMPKDDGSPGTVHNCHIAGMETGIESQCEQMLNNCVTVCNAAPGFGDAGGFDPVPKCDGGT